MATKNAVLSCSIEDAYGIRATTDAFATVDDTKTVAQMMTDVGAWALLNQEMSQGSLVEYSVRVVDGLVSPATPAGDIEKGGLFNFSNATDHYAQGYWIPDINPSVLNAQGLIDLTNVTVTDFITFMTTAHTAITIVTKGVRALNGLIDALISFRKHRKPLARKTKEI